MARALTTPSQVSQTRLAGVSLQTLASSEARRYFSGDRRFSAAVEEDLDAALDNILGDAFKEAKNPVDMQPGTHMKHSRPIPENLVEEVRPQKISSSLIMFERFVEYGMKLTSRHCPFSGGSGGSQRSQVSLYE